MFSRCSSIPEVSAAISQHTGDLVEGADTCMQGTEHQLLELQWLVLHDLN